MSQSHYNFDVLKLQFVALSSPYPRCYRGIRGNLAVPMITVQLSTTYTLHYELEKLRAQHTQASCRSRRATALGVIIRHKYSIARRFVYLLWRRGVVASGVRRMNEVNARRARLVLGWVTVFGRVFLLGM